MTPLAAWMWTSVRSAGWAPTSVFVLHVVVSRAWSAYEAVPELDIPMHFLGGVAIAFFLWRSVIMTAAGPVLGSLTLFGSLLLTFASVCSATVVWEFAEWASDHLGWTHAQKGLGDTLLDMLLGIAGGVFFLGFAWRSYSGSLSSTTSVRSSASGSWPV